MKRITATPPSLIAYLKRVWEYRYLLYTFSVRDIKIKYAQSLLGVLWSLLLPVIAVIIIHLLFGKLLKVNTGEAPYILFAYPGMLGWYYFLYVTSFSGISLIQSQDIIRKVYFPRIIIPLSRVFTGLVEFAIWLIILLILRFYFKPVFSFKLFYIFYFLIINALSGLTIGLWLSSLSIRRRDLLMIIPYLIGFGIFATPVFYPPSMIPDTLKFVMYYNPMAYVIEGYRWTLGLNPFPSVEFLPGLLILFTLLLGAIFSFIRLERKIADYI